jgi:hypothetical protein
LLSFLFKDLLFFEGNFEVKSNTFGVIERKFRFIQLMLEVESL